MDQGRHNYSMKPESFKVPVNLDADDRKRVLTEIDNGQTILCSVHREMAPNEKTLTATCVALDGKSAGKLRTQYKRIVDPKPRKKKTTKSDS